MYPRDRALLDLLDEHLVLTTGQIDHALFGALRACQRRLAHLRGLELVDRFTLPRPRSGGSVQGHWALGRLGLDWHAAAREEPPATARAARLRLARLAHRPTLAHLLGVNSFFTALMGVARNRPDTALVRWWSEPTATRLFTAVFPDGHGLWHENGRTVGFFLEYDTGTENLPRLVDKLGGYEQLAADGGPVYPVLFSLHSPARETNLHTALAGRLGRVPVATTTRPTPDPSAAVWAPVGGDPARRLRLADLPSDHGPRSRRNATWPDGQLTDDTGRDSHHVVPES
ncbi:MAG TPA: replication-relaxation family protein [Micromonosporaceae bacterium]